MENGDGQIQCHYLQIVCVKQTELDQYQRAWPQLNFFALPADASDLGIGASRHYMKKLASELRHPSFPYCMFLDDSVRCFKGVTLVDDPHQPFGAQSTDKPQTHDISLRQVLQHFLDQGFREGDLTKFGTIGFMVWRGPISYSNAYLRGECTDALSTRERGQFNPI
jgi:hypothetical protein